MEKIYVKFSDVPKTKTRKAFIRNFINAVSFPSYSDEECTIEQCSKNRYRSITELHQMTLVRFPKTSFEAVIRIIKELIDEDAKIAMIYCTQVNKVVLRYYDKATHKYITSYSRDNHYTTKGVDGYSLKDYEEIINKL